MPNTRTTPDLAPKPVILTVRSWARRALGDKKRRAGEQRRNCNSQGFHGFLHFNIGQCSYGCRRAILAYSIGPANGRQCRRTVSRFVQFYSITLGYYVSGIQAAFVVQSPAAAKSRRGRRNVAHSGKPQAAQARSFARRGAVIRRRPRKPAPTGSERKAGSGRDIFSSLRPNAANFAALTPVSFLPRSAEIHPGRVARHPRHASIHLSPILRPSTATGIGACGGRRARRRYGFSHAAQRAGDAGSALRRADAGRGAQHHQYAARAGDDRLHSCSMARPKS